MDHQVDPRSVITRYADDPLIVELIRRARDPGSEPPAVDAVPPFLEEWAAAAACFDDFEVHRLVGRLLVRAAGSARALGVGLLFRTARALDLLALFDAVPSPEIRAELQALKAATRGLAAPLADAIVAAALPEHVASLEGFAQLASDVPVVDFLATKDGRLVEYVVTSVRKYLTVRTDDAAQARPEYDRLRTWASRTSERLLALGSPDTADIEREVARLDVPCLSIGLIELALEAPDMPPLPLALLMLALHAQVQGTDHAATWSSALACAAASAIHKTGVVALLPLRLPLLDEGIANLPPGGSRANLHFVRGNTRVGLAASERASPLPAAQDYIAAMDYAIADGDRPGGTAGPTAHESLATWVREHVAAPVTRFLERVPSELVWVPGPGLRSVSPAAAWPGVSVAAAASPDLPGFSGRPRRRRSTLVVMADPGSEGAGRVAALGSIAENVVDSIARVAADRGRVRRLASVGKRYGRALLGVDSNVRDTPASASDLLAEAVEHDVVVILAHGEMSSAEAAWLWCIDRNGALEKLDVAVLANNPESVTGATVVLLSCETGRVGRSLVRPGGIAGTLIAAGARYVVAPLWPVDLDTAGRVGRAVAEGLADGLEPWVALARVQHDVGDGAVLLGRPSPSPAEQKAVRELRRLAFVTWMG